MKRLFRKTKGLIRGAPTAVVLSAVIHLILISIAGGLVIFSVVQRQEKKFVPPPPVERPKIDLKKPRVRVKKTARPKTSERIVSKSTQVMPDVQLPEISSMSSGLGGGIGGFEMVPDPADMTLFGSKKSVSVGNDFEGTFYALGLDRQGRRNNMTMDSYFSDAMRRFYDSGWNPRSLSMFYRAPQKLYATFIYTPMTASEFVPRNFGIPDDLYTFYWMVHYRGKIKSNEGGKFRFWGRAETLMAVRVDGEEVGHFGHEISAEQSSDWRSTAEENRKYWRGHGPMAVGDWFELEPGKPVEMDVVVGNHNGAWTQHTLTVEEYGKEYPKNEDGAPILPVFKTAEIPDHLIDEIKYSMIDGEADLYSDLMFNVY
jgi:hypothetical protein